MSIIRGSMGEQIEVAQPQQFTLANVPGNPQRWEQYRKTVLTPMMRIEGPFVCETKDGPAKCSDGWLAVDEQGFPYPVDARVHTKSYELVDRDAENPEDVIATLETEKAEQQKEIEALKKRNAELEADIAAQIPVPAQPEPERRPAARPQAPRRDS